MTTSYGGYHSVTTRLPTLCLVVTKWLYAHVYGHPRYHTLPGLLGTGLGHRRCAVRRPSRRAREAVGLCPYPQPYPHPLNPAPNPNPSPTSFLPLSPNPNPYPTSSPFPNPHPHPNPNPNPHPHPNQACERAAPGGLRPPPGELQHSWSTRS